MDKKRILLTGFEPFGENTVNTSYEAVKLVGDIDGFDIKKICLPVTWDGAVSALYSAVDEFEPDAVIMCGLAASSSHIRIERVGINLCGAIKDNDGKLPSEFGERSIVENAPTAFFSTFDFSSVLSSLKSENIPASYSFSAGTYICNLILYSMLYKDSIEKSSRKTGFVHVPNASEFVASSSISLGEIVRAVECVICHCV